MEALIPNPHLDFWNSDPKIHFWANLGRKSQSSLYWLKIGTNGISRMLILIRISIFWIFNPKSIFGQVWAKKVKVVGFAWKLPQMLPRGCWFLFQHFFLISSQKNPFWGKFGPKKFKLSVFPENWHTWYLEDADP